MYNKLASAWPSPDVVAIWGVKHQTEVLDLYLSSFNSAFQTALKKKKVLLEQGFLNMHQNHLENVLK